MKLRNIFLLITFAATITPQTQPYRTGLLCASGAALCTISALWAHKKIKALNARSDIEKAQPATKIALSRWKLLRTLCSVFGTGFAAVTIGKAWSDHKSFQLQQAALAAQRQAPVVNPLQPARPANPPAQPAHNPDLGVRNNAQIQEDRRMREEQDAEYNRALAQDQEKERQARAAAQEKQARLEREEQERLDAIEKQKQQKRVMAQKKEEFLRKMEALRK